MKTIVLLSLDDKEAITSLPALKALQQIATDHQRLMEFILDYTSEVAYKDLSSPIYQRRPEIQTWVHVPYTVH